MKTVSTKTYNKTEIQITFDGKYYGYRISKYHLVCSPLFSNINNAVYAAKEAIEEELTK